GTTPAAAAPFSGAPAPSAPPLDDPLGLPALPGAPATPPPARAPAPSAPAPAPAASPALPPAPPANSGTAPATPAPVPGAGTVTPAPPPPPVPAPAAPVLQAAYRFGTPDHARLFVHGTVDGATAGAVVDFFQVGAGGARGALLGSAPAAAGPGPAAFHA